MKKSIKPCLLAFIIMIFFFQSNAQISNYIYTITNPSSGVFYFAKVEITTGIMTNLQLMPFTFLSVNSSCIDNQAQKYYFCTGSNLLTIDPLNGNVLSNDTLPISSNAKLWHIAFNPCDFHIYGIVSDTSAISFCKYDPGTGVMTIISSMSSSTGFTNGNSFIDPDSSIYIFENAFINGIDLATGQVLYSSLINDLPNENYGHPALKCNTHQIFGTSADINAGVKYLSIIDPYTGNVTHVSNAGWNVGIWKPADGGSRIDQNSGFFYYSGAGGVLVGANTISGNMVYNQTVAPANELLFIEHFSECICNTTGVIQNENSTEDFKIFPGLFSEKLNVNLNNNTLSEIIIYDISARKLLHQVFTNSISLNTAQLAKGIYIYEIRNKNGLIKNGKIVKE